MGALGRDRVLQRVLGTLTPLVVTSARQRLSDGHVTFDDLLVLTRRLVREKPEVLDELRRNLSHVFVDEFQDTDPVQYEIIERICDSLVPHAPVRFAVGDPKQAIYAFRGADVQLFNRLADAASLDNSLVQLRANYRTRIDVAKWINATLTKRFASDNHEVQSPYEELAAVRAAQAVDQGPAITLLGLASDGSPIEQPTALAMARQESADIAAVIHDAVDRWSVGPDRDGNGFRTARLSDVAILVRTRGGLPTLEHALNHAGIPYRIEGGSLVYESREVYELLRVLRAVDDPSNAAKVVAALRTTVMGVSDLDLFNYRYTPDGLKRNWKLPWSEEFEDGGVVGARRTFEALRTLGHLSDRKHARSPAQMLAELYDDRLGLAVAPFEGETSRTDTWRRVRFVIDEARQWSDSTGGTLREYLEWVTTRIEATDRSEIATDEDEDSVRILTIHAAKGLEFPIVILAGLGRGDNNDATSVKASVNSDGVAEVRMGILRTIKASSDKDKERALAEEARLLYVAMTRAEDHLVVSMHRPQKGSSVAKRLQTHLCLDRVVLREPVELGDTKPALADLSAFADDNGDDLDLPRPWRPDPAERTIWTPSALARKLSTHGGNPAVSFADADPDDDPDVDESGFTAPIGTRAAPETVIPVSKRTHPTRCSKNAAAVAMEPP